MTDRPIIFSGPMVRALLAGCKTQTRRLANSPLRRVQVGDRLYVREAWRTHRVSDELKPSLLTGEGRVWFEADRDNCDQHGRLRPGMHMPRWASRLTLVVEATKIEPLQTISEADGEAEGCVWDSADGYDVWYLPWVTDKLPHTGTAAECYANLWNSLRPAEGQRWENNPDVIALTFRVVPQNIRQVPA